MSLANSSLQERIEELLRKSFLGEEIVDTQFHLFSAISVQSGRVTKPRVLCANSTLLAQGSNYFLDLLSSDINPSDGSLSDLTDANDVQSCIPINDYGYESDSDLDDEEEPVHIGSVDASKDRSATASTNPPKINTTTQPKDDEESSEDDSESVNSDMFVMSPEHPTMDEPFGIGSVTSGETTVEESSCNKMSPGHTAKRLRSLASRHILIKDTAFQTWYALLYYLYTNKVSFLPLSSATNRGRPSGFLGNSLDEPRCSAKSMYRLACKVGIQDLRDEALAHIRGNLTEDNILKELSCGMVSRHPQLLEMELDVLYTHIASAPVVAGFPALAQRIAHKDLAHGADIIVGIHSRILKEIPPSPSTSRPLVPPPLSPLSNSAGLELSVPPPPEPAVCRVPPILGGQCTPKSEHSGLDDLPEKRQSAPSRGKKKLGRA